jgi:hypothetical protein
MPRRHPPLVLKTKTATGPQTLPSFFMIPVTPLGQRLAGLGPAPVLSRALPGAGDRPGAETNANGWGVYWEPARFIPFGKEAQ